MKRKKPDSFESGFLNWVCLAMARPLAELGSLGVEKALPFRDRLALLSQQSSRFAPLGLSLPCESESPAETEKARLFRIGLFDWVPGSDLLSHGSCHTIIG
ncbi:hypothetical protein, partial [Oceanisphaera psychrotolerans]|uniref:hypothetical protein n=1 Tax=Oceanisphaera psychrotolerans TaxID=1414654 RepID=UPI001C311C47